jgi:hypothetical protein
LGRQRPLETLPSRRPVLSVKRKFALIFHQSKSERQLFPKAATQNIRKTMIRDFDFRFRPEPVIHYGLAAMRMH